MGPNTAGLMAPRVRIIARNVATGKMVTKSGLQVPIRWEAASDVLGSLISIFFEMIFLYLNLIYLLMFFLLLAH